MSLTVQQGTALAKKVRDWLSNSGQGTVEGELKEFVDDLENARNVSTWAGVDFERLLPFRLPVSAAARRLSILRNSLIFLPIIVTWASIERAVDSFSNLDEGNFLEHWHNMDAPWGLKFVAWVDVIIISLVVLITLIVGTWEESEKKKKRLEREHSGLMVALERDLAGYRYLSLKDINETATTTLQNLLGSSQEIERAARSFADSSQDAHKAIEGAHETVIKVFDPAVQRLDAVITSLGQAATIHQNMVGLVQGLQTGLADQLRAIETSATRILQNLDQHTSRLLNEIDVKASGAAQGMTSALSQGVTNLASTAQTVSADLNGQLGRLLADLTRTLNAVVDDLGIVTADLGSTTSAVMVNTATLADDLDAIHDRLERLARRS